MLEGDGGCDDTTGKQGVLLAGGLDWMRAAMACGMPAGRFPA